jgi:hypothetical protein
MTPWSWERGSVGPVTEQGFQPPVERIAEPMSSSFTPRMAELPPSVHRFGVDPAPAPVVIPPAPQPPSEAEARASLAVAQDIKRDADALVTAAEAAYLRATQHLADCIDEVASYDDLDGEVAAFTAAALRSGEGRPRVDQDEALRGKIAARDQAHATLAAARGAEATLAEELEAARAAAKDAAAAHEFAVRDALFAEAAKLGEKYVEAQRAADALAATAAGAWDALADARGMVRGKFVTPPAVQAARTQAGKRVAAVEQWRKAADALRADSTAVVEIAVEQLPEVVWVVDNTKPPPPFGPSAMIAKPI